MSARIATSVGTAVFAASLLSACVGDRGNLPTGDTSSAFAVCDQVYDGPVTIEEALVTCRTPTQVRFMLRTQGWTSGATIFSQETGNPGVQWADEHDLETFRFGACEDFDQLQRSLQTGVTEDLVNLSTRFSCEEDGVGGFVHHGDPVDGGVMTYIVRAYAQDRTLGDCLVFGHDPAGLIAGDYDAVITPSRPEELVTCTVGTYTKSSTSSTTDSGTSTSDTTN